MGGFANDATAEPLAKIEPVVSGSYCDVVLFDVNDQENYETHIKKICEKIENLKNANNINKNTKALLEVTFKIQSVDIDQNTTSKDANSCFEEQNKRSIPKDVDNLPKVESATSLASNAEPESTGLPTKDMSDARPIVETSEDGKPDCPPTPVSSLRGAADQKPKSGFAGLPIDDTADSWMDDDVGPIADSDEEGTDDSKVEKSEEDVKLNNNIPSPEKVLPTEQPKPAFAGLPIDDTADSWMDDDVGPLDDSDDETEATKVEKDEKNVITEDKVLPVEQPKPAFAGLPIDDAADSWMDDDVGTMIEGDDEEDMKEKEVAVKQEKEKQKNTPKPN